VLLYAVIGGGHTWPGSPVEIASLGPTTHEIDASQLIWAFFAAHPRSR
jgi:polyhydroxybutyrate depolymerase